MKKRAKKLVLAKETVLSLEEGRLDKARGAAEAAVDPISYWPEECSRGTCG
jgi:hypothetical protein